MSAASASPKVVRGRPSTGARERILGAARAIVAEGGYAALTTQRVATDSGQNKALIQYHFGSKDGLVEAVAEAMAAEIVAVLEQATSDTSSAEAFVAATLEGMWEFSTAHPSMQRLYFETVAQSIADPHLREVVNRTRGAYRGILRSRIADLTGGRVGARAAGSAATFFMAAFDGLLLDLVERGDGAELRGARELLRAQAVALLSS